MHIPCAGLDSEQTALVDFLVLARGSFFCGFIASTFSYYLQFYRHMLNFELSTNKLATYLVDGSDLRMAQGAAIFPV